MHIPFIIQQHLSGSLAAMTTTFYNKSAWVDLSDFETSGSFAVSSNKIVSPNDTSSYIRFDPTALNAYVLEIQFKWLVNNGGANIFQVKGNSINTATSQGYTVSLGGSSNYGKLVGFRELSGVTLFTTDALSPVVGDVITLKVEKADNSATYVTATIGSTSITKPMNLQHNTVKLSLQACGNTFEIQSIKWYAPYPRPISRMVFGDSISVGANSSDSQKYSYAAIIHAIRSAGFGDRTAEGVARIKDLTQRLQPKKVFVMLGTNDIGNGVSSATWQANLTTIYNAFTNAGIGCVFLCPPPSNNFDASVVKTWLNTNYSTHYIDTYTPLVGTGTGLNASYNSGDGTHPNDAGHALIASTILNHSLYT
jgi:lysophospholipase L1-like esterase